MNEFLGTTIVEFGKHHFTVAQLTNVVLIIASSWLLLYIISVPLNRRVKKGTLEKSSAYAAKQIASYIVWTLCIVLSIQAAGFNISLLLAGSAALLVGIGLGLQQTFSDFISGVILLLDSSIKIDDILELDGMVCRVIKIGIRTSVVVNRDEVYVIVPNSKFTSERVINWTHSDDNARFSVLIGVHYKSDAEQVKNILLDCANKHPHVLQSKLPIVRLEGFDDSAITFNLLFWSKEIFRVEQIRSDLRFYILKAFREQGIEIPYPQRDLYLKQIPENAKFPS